MLFLLKGKEKHYKIIFPNILWFDLLKTYDSGSLVFPIAIG